MSLESIIIQLSYFGIFLLMIFNGVISNPSSQVLYIIAGYFVSIGTLNFWFVLIAGLLGNVVGNIILYELTIRKGLKYVLKFSIVPKREIKKVEIAFRRKGSWFIFLGKLLPAIKVVIPIIAAIGKMKRSLFIILMIISSFIWASIFVGIGYVFGKSTEVFKTYAPILLIIAFVVMWVFYKYINSKAVLKELER